MLYGYKKLSRKVRNMLTLNKEDTKTEKSIVIGLWVIALYFIVGSSATIIADIMTKQFNSLILAPIFMTLGIGLLLEKKWALQVSAAVSFMIIVSSLGIVLSYLDDGMLDLDDSIVTLAMLVGAIVAYIIFTHKVSMQIYDVDFTLFKRVLSILYWTLGMGLTGFIGSWSYVEMYEEGVYRGFIVVYATVFFIGLGFVVGLLRFLMFKKK